MADFTYVGLTALIRKQEDTIEKLNVLAYAIEPLAHNHKDIEMADEDAFLEKDYKHRDITSSQEYYEMVEHTGLFYPEANTFPVNTPAKYQKASVTEVNEKFLRVYIPVTSKRCYSIVKSAVLPIVSALFEDDLTGAMIKQGTESEDFEKLEYQIIDTDTINSISA